MIRRHHHLLPPRLPLLHHRTDCHSKNKIYMRLLMKYDLLILGMWWFNVKLFYDHMHCSSSSSTNVPYTMGYTSVYFWG